MFCDIGEKTDPKLPIEPKILVEETKGVVILDFVLSREATMHQKGGFLICAVSLTGLIPNMFVQLL